jgi:hypothetical protein
MPAGASLTGAFDKGLGETYLNSGDFAAVGLDRRCNFWKPAFHAEDVPAAFRRRDELAQLSVFHSGNDIRPDPGYFVHVKSPWPVNSGRPLGGLLCRHWNKVESFDPAEPYAESIKTVDFDSKISDAIKSGMYRGADLIDFRARVAERPRCAIDD